MIHEYISYGFDSNVFVIENSKTILHVGGDPRNVPIAIGEKDAEDLEKGTEKTIFDFVLPFFKGFEVSKRLKDGDVIETEDYRLEVLHTPGHTNGSICLYDEAKKIIFSGDTFFIEGIGRTDLPSGDMEALKKSLKRLASLDIEKVYPGHGEVGKCDINKILDFWF
jgi:glyoxylase-like metal-dependent hydrolase (beta-lactamase superfamily II)